jgi:hypothetical protein
VRTFDGSHARTAFTESDRHNGYFILKQGKLRTPPSS